MKSNFGLAVILVCLLAAWPVAAAPKLKYVLIVSRHGVRAPTWDAARLNQYSAQPWPDWGVAPGELTAHGFALMKLMGAYYREWLGSESLLDIRGCKDAARIHIVADASQRTRETGRAFSESLMPGCGIPIDAPPSDQKDPLFSGIGAPDPNLSLKAVQARLNTDFSKLLIEHRAALDALQAILSGGHTTAQKAFVPPFTLTAALTGTTVEIAGPLAPGSTLSENLLLEYANGFEGANLGWGRLTPENLMNALELHAAYEDLMRRTTYLARTRGSNLLQHILLSIEQAASGAKLPGALGSPGDALLVISGHDTNLSNLSGMLGLSWKMPGYQPDDAPPGGALIFSLWRDDAGHDAVTLQYVTQSLDQMHKTERLTLATPPERQQLTIPGCAPAAPVKGCAWSAFRRIAQNAIDPAFARIAK